jgi:hypothetical protein
VNNTNDRQVQCICMIKSQSKVYRYAAILDSILVSISNSDLLRDLFRDLKAPTDLN